MAKTKSIKANKMAYDDVDFNWNEATPKFVPILGKYFKYIRSHSDGYDFNREKNSIFCYSTPKGFKTTRNEIKLPDFRDGVSLYDIAPIFAEFYHNGGYIEDTVDILILNKIRIGFISTTKRNVVYASDWTHQYPIHYQIVKHILENLEKMGLLKPIRRKKKKIPKVKITLGCDPEFEEISNGRVIPTSLGTKDFDEGGIGRDGAGNQIELRPNPSTKPVDVIKNIKILMAKTGKQLSVQGDRYPLGGHIHIGVKNVDLSVLQALDDWLGKKLIDLSGLARGSYKNLGAYETKTWGFEYRSLPSCIFATPEMAKITFKITKYVVEKCYSRNGLKYRYTESWGTDDQEYLRVLTPKQMDYFFNFIDDYKSDNFTNINAYWHIGRPKIKASDLISIRDEWAYPIEIYFRDKLKKAFTQKQLRKIRFITLYGFSKKRGDITNFKNSIFKSGDMSGFSNVVFYPGQVQFAFGLPYSFRVEVVLSTVHLQIADEIIKIIKNEIKKV